MITPVVTRLDPGSWRFTWPVGTPPYGVWYASRLLATVATETYDYDKGDHEDTPPGLEIVNAGDVAKNSLHMAYMLLQWRGNQNADFYIVEQYISGVWTVVATVPEDARGYYRWRSPALDDVTTYQFRVSATDVVGNMGTAITFTTEVCRVPAPPRVVVTLSGGNIVVSAG